MVKPEAVLDIRPLGVVVELRRTAEDTGGAYVEFDVIGRGRGIIAAPHVHPQQTERHEVIEGAMALTIDGHKHLLRPGDPAVEVPAGATHTQRPHGPGTGRVRVQLHPAGGGEAFLRRLAELAAAGEFNRLGFPKPVAGAALLRDFSAVGHPPGPPRVQQALAGAVLRLASREYLFVDEWDVAAPREAVFDALADARTYPEWWRPVYLSVEADGEPAVGKRSHQRFKGRFPYHLRTTSELVRLERPHVVSGEVDGDLRGTGVWTLTETASGGTHVRFDWRVHADRPLLRVLTPVLRPAFRWNHAWAIKRAMEGLEPYARERAAPARDVVVA